MACLSRFSGTISLNAAIFTAVLLGSRLQSNEHVFAFVLLAIEIFAMFPIFQREVKVRSTWLSNTVAAVLPVLDAVAWWWSHSAAFVYMNERIPVRSGTRSGCTS